MKLWLRQGRGEGLWLYIEHGGLLYLIYILNTFGNQQIRVRKLDGASALELKSFIELDKILEAIKQDKVLDDPFAFTIGKQGSPFKEYKLGMLEEIQNPQLKKDKKEKKK
jgi:hypothetical protein